MANLHIIILLLVKSSFMIKNYSYKILLLQEKPEAPEDASDLGTEVILCNHLMNANPTFIKVRRIVSRKACSSKLFNGDPVNSIDQLPTDIYCRELRNLDVTAIMVREPFISHLVVMGFIAVSQYFLDCCL